MNDPSKDYFLTGRPVKKIADLKTDYKLFPSFFLRFFDRRLWLPLAAQLGIFLEFRDQALLRFWAGRCGITGEFKPTAAAFMLAPPEYHSTKSRPTAKWRRTRSRKDWKTSSWAGRGEVRYGVRKLAFAFLRRSLLRRGEMATPLDKLGARKVAPTS